MTDQAVFLFVVMVLLGLVVVVFVEAFAKKYMRKD